MSERTRARAAPVEGIRARVLAALACCAAVALPFLAVRFPPITDLPQHLAQIRLFLDTWRDPAAGYVIQWFTPYSAAYALLGAGWALSSPIVAGRVAMIGLAVLWTASVHALAGVHRRPVAAAILAGLLFFNQALYWGFLSFAAGWVAFVVWWIASTRTRPGEPAWRTALRQGGAALLLYTCHALWFAFGVAWLLGYALLHRWPARVLAWRLAGVAPVVVAAALWYPHLAAMGFVSPTVWFSPPLERLSPAWFVDALLGGLRGPTEPLVAAVLVGWVALGCWAHRYDLRRAVDPDLLWTGLLLCGMALVLPDQHMNTILFAERWLPAGALCLVLAAPAPGLAVGVQRALAAATLATFALATALTWAAFERRELSGLDAALAALPEQPRVLGLDLVKESDLIKGRPFLQTFAYAQVLRGGQLNMSFAGHAPSLVVFPERRRIGWTPHLEWFAERVRPGDFAYFDYALINGRDDIHAQTAQLGLVPVTTTGRWRLYRVPAAPH